MTQLLNLAAFIALLPAMANLQAAPRPGSIELGTCLGASITIPLKNAPPPSSGQPCCAKGCHSGSSSRKRFDSSQ